MGSGTLNAAGQATLDVSLGVGSHSLTASFAATTTFAASTSSAVTETVNHAATTTTLMRYSANSVTRGQSVVFTVNVAAIAPGPAQLRARSASSTAPPCSGPPRG